MAITIIGGPPGTGKTTLARLLSAGVPRGVHIESDRFFHFVAHRVDPSLPGANSQNATVVRAYVAAAREYSAGGYEVYLDGVIGPWLLPLITPMASGIRYVLLYASRDVVLARSRNRDSQPSATADVIVRMHKQFSNILEAFRAHVIHTDHKSVEEVANEYRSGASAGAYELRNA